MDRLLEEARGLMDQMVEDRRWLHRHPECGYDLTKTTAYVKRRLEDMGYEPEEIIECGLVCGIGDPEGPCFLLRADMDALPLPEETGLPFASTNGNMHACGHDFHISILLAAAQLLKNHESELKGYVKLMFQPDEEATDPRETLGNQAMIDAGVLENPKVGAAAGLHVCPIGVPTGEVGANEGPAFFSVDDVEIEIEGTGTHGAQPQKGVDPFNVMAHIYLGLQEVIAREVDPYEACVLTFGKMGGGTAANIIPKHASMLGTLRTVNEGTRQRLQASITSIVEKTAEAYGAKATVGFLRGLPPVYNNPELTRELLGYYEQATGKDRYVLGEPFSGSDDMGTMSQVIPITYFQLGAAPADAEPLPLHNPRILFDEDSMPVGAALLAAAAMGWIEARA